jgi:hypothetical protein
MLRFLMMEKLKSGDTLVSSSDERQGVYLKRRCPSHSKDALGFELSGKRNRVYCRRLVTRK